MNDSTLDPAPPSAFVAHQQLYQRWVALMKDALAAGFEEGQRDA